jgi:hypothetical protein
MLFFTTVVWTNTAEGRKMEECPESPDGDIKRFYKAEKRNHS